MYLPASMREALIDDIDEFLGAFSGDPEPEQVAAYVVEQLETYADDEGIEEVISSLEEEAELEASLMEALESEMASNDEFEYTGEEVVSLLERLCTIDWGDDEDDEDEDDDEGEDDDEDLDEEAEED